MGTFNYSDPSYRKAREEALARSGGKCQFCGLADADHAHHWKMSYDPAPETSSSHLTALCADCHQLAHLVRRWAERRRNGRKRSPKTPRQPQRAKPERSRAPMELQRFANRARKR